MNARLSPAELEALSIEELEDYLAKLEEQEQEGEEHLKKSREDLEKQTQLQASLEARAKQIDAGILETKTQTASYVEKTEQLNKKSSENEERLASLGKKIGGLDSEITSLDRKKEELRQERQAIINSAFTPVRRASKDSLSSSGSTPPSQVRQDDGLSGDLSSFSLSSRDPVADEKDKSKDSPPAARSKPSSHQAIASALLPPPAIVPSPKAGIREPSAGQAAPSNGNKTPLLSDKNLPKQQPPAAASNAAVPQQPPKGLLNRLGLTKSTPQPALAVGTNAAAKSDVTPPRHGFSNNNGH